MPLKIHFLNVGRGDCTIIEFPSGRVSIVDIDNLTTFDPKTEKEIVDEYRKSVEYSLAVLLGDFPRASRLAADFLSKKRATLTDPFLYFDQHLGQQTDIFRLIITHPDMDHMTGLDRLRQDRLKTIENFWHSGRGDFNLATTTDREWDSCPYSKLDWTTYKQLRESVNDPKGLRLYRGSSGSFWTDDGIELWAPSPGLEELALTKNNSNILSMILKISFMGHSIILGGDATADETWSTIYPETNMTGISVFKASHHGRRSGYHGPSVKEMSPWLTITSVANKDHDATQNYRRYSQHTVSLRDAGDIVITIDDSGQLYYSGHIENHWKDKIV